MELNHEPTIEIGETGPTQWMIDGHDTLETGSGTRIDGLGEVHLVICERCGDAILAFRPLPFCDHCAGLTRRERFTDLADPIKAQIAEARAYAPRWIMHLSEELLDTVIKGRAPWN